MEPFYAVCPECGQEQKLVPMVEGNDLIWILPRHRVFDGLLTCLGSDSVAYETYRRDPS